MAFLDIEFPKELIPFFSKTTQCVTSIGKMKNGAEFRKQIVNEKLTCYKLFNSIRKQEQIRLLEDFFHITAGRLYSFKMFDITDNQIQMSPCKKIGEKTVQVQKIIIFGGTISAKDLTKLKENTVQVFKNGALFPSGYTVNRQTGVITFNENVEDNEISVTCEYYKHVRFDTDSLTLSMKEGGSFEVDGVAMVEVID